MKRIYEEVILEHFNELDVMLFVMGPRQVGKTTTCKDVGQSWKDYYYLTWDNPSDRRMIISGSDVVAAYTRVFPENDNKEPIIIFDEIHKYKKWKLFIKGFYDSYIHKGKAEKASGKILVTGSGKLNVYKRGGDSLMGRYFPFRFHPLSIAEIVHQTIPESEIRPLPKKISDEDFEKLLTFGGYPAPFIHGTQRFYNRWKNLRLEKLFKEDLRDLTKVHEIDQIQTMAILLQNYVGSNITYDSLASNIRVSSNTVRNWLSILKSLYYCFEVRPWSKNVTRSLLKEPKYYLWDWSLCEDVGARAENFVALHLLKAVHFWTDYGFGDYELHYVRDKEQREVDFLITKNKKPWILVEVKHSEKSVSPSLSYFKDMLNAPYAFQLSFNAPYIHKNCFDFHEPIVVPARTFLSQLI